MSREYLTSDLHLLHTNIIKYAERKKYQSTDESCEKMSWNIVNTINATIPDEKDVTLWNLGDLFYGRLFSAKTLNQLKEYVSIMKGKNRTLNIVLGNHDKQFKQHADWKKLKPLTKASSFTEIFQELGFTNVYDKPILYKENIIFSHEPIFLTPGNQFKNIHGHVHQKGLKDSEGYNTLYFCYDLENYAMVRKAYRDSGRPLPELSLKKDWEDFQTDSRLYFNSCWDYHNKVLNLNDVIKELNKENYQGQECR